MHITSAILIWTEVLSANYHRAGLLKTLYKDLHTLAPKWSTFGIHLGVPNDILKGLQGEDSMVERCFMEVLSAWLNGGNASVDKLVEALRFPGVSHGRLAGEIERDRQSELAEMCITYYIYHQPE